MARPAEHPAAQWYERDASHFSLDDERRMLAAAQVRISVLDVPAFREFVERVQSFVQEYAWHTRDCAAIDADGEWHRSTSPACTCGYDEAVAALVPPEAT